jgi:hypothetical protein
MGRAKVAKLAISQLDEKFGLGSTIDLAAQSILSTIKKLK